MGDSGEPSEFNPEVCHLKHESINSEFSHCKEDFDRITTASEKRFDKVESKFNALVIGIVTAVGALMSPIIIDLIKKVMSSPVVK